MLGIDVSRWQGVIDWQQVKNDGVDFAIVQTWVGHHNDDQNPWSNDQYDYRAEYNISEAIAAGVPVMPYMFTYMTTDAYAEREADDVIWWFEHNEINCKKIVWWDLEDVYMGDIGRVWVWSTDAGAAAVLRRFQLIKAKLDAAGITLGIYTSRSHYWDEMLTDSWYDTNVLKWVANYYDPSVVDPPPQPPYTPLNWSRSWVIHQYSSNGRINGIGGGQSRVDLNYCPDGSFFEKDPTPEPTPIPVPQIDYSRAFPVGRIGGIRSTMKGDTRRDGKISIEDLLNYRLRLFCDIEFLDDSVFTWDANGDGEFDIIDLQTVLQHLYGISSVLPAVSLIDEDPAEPEETEEYNAENT